MHGSERNLDRITTLLGQCLGRIEAHAADVQHMDEGATTFLTAEEIDNETAELQQLVGSLLDNVVQADDADLNHIVDQAVRSCIAAVDMPLVVRQRLAPGLPRVACNPGQLTFAVQRALGVGIGHLEPGGELAVVTRREGDTIVFEMESHGEESDSDLDARTATLLEFVADMKGTCRTDADERGTLLLAIELPVALAADDR
ncbi:MAG: hypothetical protein JNK78_13490 [Planctomycetes bacterium]|nr:hypothetical protein [Planctomycetota bacterium]